MAFFKFLRPGRHAASLPHGLLTKDKQKKIFSLIQIEQPRATMIDVMKDSP
jgi:hypothetical protein